MATARHSTELLDCVCICFQFNPVFWFQNTVISPRLRNKSDLKKQEINRGIPLFGHFIFIKHLLCDEHQTACSMTHSVHPLGKESVQETLILLLN